jgi:hypothetical protein
MTFPTLRTYIAPTTQSLLRHLGRSPTLPPSSVNLFAFSAHADDLQEAVAYLTALPDSVGGLTASLHKGAQLAIASYPATSCLPFRSTVPGIPQAEVGRIRTYRPPTREDRASETRLDNALAGGVVNWNDALSESGSFELPSDLQHIRCVGLCTQPRMYLQLHKRILATSLVFLHSSTSAMVRLKGC